MNYGSHFDHAPSQFDSNETDYPWLPLGQADEFLETGKKLVG